jgi:hypothetical protein
MSEQAFIQCRDGCGALVRPDDNGDAPGWTLLAIAGGWRCGACTRALDKAARIAGLNEDSPDNLPPDSRGALPKETASTITPPVRIR